MTQIREAYIQKGNVTTATTERHADPYKGIVVYMPTRNRAEIVMQSIRLVLESPVKELHLVVSDNSTDALQIRTVETFCREQQDPRLHYIRPPRPLSMSEHLDWLIGQALERFDANHFTCLWDRMVIKRNGVETLRKIALTYPDKLCSFFWDAVIDDIHPVSLYQYPWTGTLVEVKAKHLLRLAAQSHERYAPKMTNCLIPRSVFNAVHSRFGDYCNSITADICFGYRCLALAETMLVYDGALYITYGMHRSNAQSQHKGIHNQDTKDFLANLQQQRTILNYAAPIPEATVPGNQTLHEYCLVKQEVGGDRFPDVDMSAYLEMLARGTRQLQNQEARREMEVILAKHGYQPPPESAQQPTGGSVLRQVRNRFVPWASASAVRQVLYSAPTKPVWLALARIAGTGLPGRQKFAFATPTEALECAMHCSRRKSRYPFNIQDLLSQPDLVRMLPPI